MVDIYSTLPTRASFAFTRISYANTAQLLGVEVSDLTWAFEEHGRCDTADWVAVPSGSPAPQPLEA